MVIIEWIKEEFVAAFWIIVGVIGIGVGLSIGDFFSGIGDKLFGSKDNT